MSSQAALMLDEPQAGRLTIQYSPTENHDVTENPPRFTWLPVIEDEAQYILRVSSDSSYSDNSTHTFTHIDLNFFTPDTVLSPHVRIRACGYPLTG